MAAARADGWNRAPLVRMTNVSIELGDWTLDDLIADTDDGIYMETNRSWSIDDQRLNFQFGTEVAYDIKCARHKRARRRGRGAPRRGHRPARPGSHRDPSG